jgi:prepilin peptidase CpaA
MPVPIVTAVVCFVALCIAVDLRTRRIPNVVSGAAMLVGLALNVLYFGVAGVVDSVAGLLLTMAMLLGPFALGGIGGGDVKMMGGVGALLGPRLAFAGLLVGVVLGGVIMAIHLARRGRLREKLAATQAMFATAALSGSIAPLRVSAANAGAITLPYSVPLGVGTVSVLAISQIVRFS